MAGRWKLSYKWFSDNAVLQCHFWRPIYEAIINMHCCLFVIGKNLSRNFLVLVQTAVNPKHNFEEVMGECRPNLNSAPLITENNGWSIS